MPLSRTTAVLALALPLVLSSKEPILRIAISGDGLTTPIAITDAAIIERFRLGEGPGTFSVTPDGEKHPSNFAHGFIVDWSRGPVEPPKALQSYEVAFITASPERTYKVLYAIDPLSNQGYVYIPGKPDAAFTVNVSIIYRGVEGKWFHAWDQWENVARPLIARARAAQ